MREFAVVLQMPPHTLGFILFILCLALFLHLRFGEKAVAAGPTILTTTGIFATFVGIAIGLSGFDAAHIQESVPSLLSGLKTAFWASVAGVGAALTIKIRYFFLGAPSSSVIDPEAGASIEDLLRAMKSVQLALAGDGDATVVSQLKLLRRESNDRLDALAKAQNEALLALSQMGSATLVEALREVIRDFNAKITEQFGDNFTKLNEAVGNLLVWQDKYKSHVESTGARLERVLEQVETLQSQLATLVARGADFTKIAEDLSALLRALETQKTQLSQTAEALSRLLLSASKSIPEVEKRIEEITSQLARAMVQNQEMLSSTLRENSATLKQGVEASMSAVSKFHHEQASQIEDLLKQSKAQTDALEKTLEAELTKSLESLGGQLAALSEKFVKDYTPLTDRLRQVVEMARRLQ